MVSAPPISTTTESLIAAQRQFFASGATKSYEFRIEQLQKLKDAIAQYEEKILAALYADLHKPRFEGVITDVAFNVAEVTTAMKNLRRWMRPQKVATDASTFPSSAKIIPEPLGIVLVIGAWNYPFQLTIGPLVGAIAAGNCAILKPSELAAHTSAVVKELVENTFAPEYITALEGDKDVTQELLQHPFDHIFFTGGTAVGKIIMRAAAEHLTPVTLELGGKSPCIVEPDIHLDHAARRIAWGKFLNAGQTCIAPDYLLVHQDVKAELLAKIAACVQELYGADPRQSEDYCRIISDRHFQRLSQLIDRDRVIMGGQIDSTQRYIAPTIMDNVTWDDPVMHDEIFGPILPVLTYTNLEGAIAQINARPKPLALYLFSQNPTTQEQILRKTSSGTVALNDTVMQVTVPGLPFGGVGDSGIGAYHGKTSFDIFSHHKSVLKRPFWLDLKLRYPPYAGKLKWVKLLLS